jgi:hypothetical protein
VVPVVCIQAVRIPVVSTGEVGIRAAGTQAVRIPAAVVPSHWVLVGSYIPHDTMGHVQIMETILVVHCGNSLKNHCRVIGTQTTCLRKVMFVFGL